VRGRGKKLAQFFFLFLLKTLEYYQDCGTDENENLLFEYIYIFDLLIHKDKIFLFVHLLSKKNYVYFVTNRMNQNY